MGQGVSMDLETAFSYYTKAAKDGHKIATERLTTLSSVSSGKRKFYFYLFLLYSLLMFFIKVFLIIVSFIS